MLKITEDNYDEYRKIFDILWKYTEKLQGLKVADEYSPIVILNNWEKSSKSIAKKGLKIGLTDVVTDLMDRPTDTKNEINDYLVSRGLLGFNHLVSIVKNVTQKALKRGRIKNLDEYYIVKEIVCGSNSDVSESEKEQLERMLDDFEAGNGKESRAKKTG